MLHHHCRRNPELQEELQIQAAVAAGDVHIVRKMLEQGYSPNIRDANGWTLLHFSAARGKERCVRVFLEHGGWQPCLHVRDRHTFMLIRLAADFVQRDVRVRQVIHHEGTAVKEAALVPELRG